VKCYEEVKKLDEKNGIVWLPYMPANNTYCLMMRKADVETYKIKTIRTCRSM
jgi:osmoprotectant transport system substrate-binding protein